MFDLTECGIPTPISIPPAWQRSGQRQKRSAQAGQRAGPFVPFIVGGIDAEIGKWPWIVSTRISDAELRS